MRIERSSRTPRTFAQIETRAKAGLAGPIGRSIAEIMRRGPGSVQEQFSRQALDSVITGKRSWPAVQDFGTRAAPSSSLRRSGRLFNAWMGTDSAAITNVSPTAVEVGVSGEALPYVGMHMRGATIRALHSNVATKHLTMQLFLGLTYGVWISARRLLQGLKVPARPVGISRTVMQRAGTAVIRHLRTGLRRGIEDDGRELRRNPPGSTEGDRIYAGRR